MTALPTPALDDRERMQSVDRRNMFRLVNELPEQFETAMGIARNLAVVPEASAPDIIVMTGVGDGERATEMAVAVLDEHSTVPIVGSHVGRLPSCAGENSAVFIVDYLGRSQLSLRTYRDARQNGSRLVCVTSGGGLLESAVRDGVSAIKIPPGQPQRTAIGYLFAPIVVVMERFGWVAQHTSEKLANAVKLLRNVRELFRFENPAARNLAKQTAEALFERMPCVYGAPGYRAAVAACWRSLINGNAKILALTGAYPDVAESEIAGWEAAERLGGMFAPVLLRDPDDKSETAELMSASVDLFGADVVEIEMRGATSFEKLLYGVYLGTYVSYYLALLYEIDPTPTRSIAEMQQRMTLEPRIAPAGREPEEEGGPEV